MRTVTLLVLACGEVLSSRRRRVAGPTKYPDSATSGRHATSVTGDQPRNGLLRDSAELQVRTTHNSRVQPALPTTQDTTRPRKEGKQHNMANTLASTTVALSLTEMRAAVITEGDEPYTNTVIRKHPNGRVRASALPERRNLARTLLSISHFTMLIPQNPQVSLIRDRRS